MYNGNPLLRGADEKIVYTDEMMEEYVKCMNDIIYFGEKYCNVITLDQGKVLIKFWDFQKKVLKAMVDPPEYLNSDTGEYEKKPYVIINASRQIGKCSCGDTKIRIRNKKTREIKEIKIEDFHMQNMN